MMEPDKDEVITALRHRIAELEDPVYYKALRARIAELEAALKQRDEFTNTNCPVCHYWPCKCPRG